MFNGNFEASTRPTTGRFPVGAQIPGWSYHNGDSHGLLDAGITDGLHLVDLPNDGGRALRLSRAATGLSNITHNRLYVPAGTSCFQFDLKVETRSASDVVEISMTLSDGTSESLGTVPLNQVTSGLRTFMLRVPQSLRDKVATLKFEITNGGAGESGQVLIDNITFACDLQISDTSGANDDGVVLFTGDADESAPATLTAGLDNSMVAAASDSCIILPGQHCVRYTNSGKFDLQISDAKVSANDFLIYVSPNAARDKTPLYTTTEMELTKVIVDGVERQLPIQLPVGRTMEWRFSAEFPANYEAGLGDKEVLLADPAVLTFHKQIVHSDRSLSGKSTYGVDLVYLADIADADRNDNVLSFANTLEGSTRRLTISHNSTATFELKDPGDGVAGSFTLVHEDDQGGEKQEVLEYVTSTRDYGLTTGELVVTYNNHKLNENSPLKLKAYATKRQTVATAQAALEGFLGTARLELDDPTLGPLDPAGESAGMYDAFKNVFPIEEVDNQRVVDADAIFLWAAGLDETLRGIYSSHIAQNDFVIAPDGDNAVEFATREFFDPTAPDDNVASYAGQDIAYTTFQQTLIGTGDTPLYESLSPASKRFRLDRVINPKRDGAIGPSGATSSNPDNPNRIATFNFLGMLRQLEMTYREDPIQYDNPEEWGKAFGWVIGHELGHNLGLYDEYLYASNGSPAENNYFGDVDFMSDFNQPATTPEINQVLSLAFDNPDHQPALNQMDHLIEWFRDRDDLHLVNFSDRADVNLPAGLSQFHGTDSGLGETGLDFQITVSDALKIWEMNIPTGLNIDIQVHVADLPSSELAEAEITGFDSDGRPAVGTITVDATANGLGWFVDQTPFDSTEFDQDTNRTTFKAALDSPAVGKYDLLSVLLHEIAHIAGFVSGYSGFASHVLQTEDGLTHFVGPEFTALLTADGDHLDSNSFPQDLLTANLPPSVRRLPSLLDAQIVMAARSHYDPSLVVPEPVIAPITNELEFNESEKHPAGDDLQLTEPAIAMRVSSPWKTQTVGEQTLSLPLPAVRLQVAISGSLHLGLVNSSFSQSNPQATDFGWNIRGSGFITDQVAVLNEDNRYFSGLSQEFVIPAEARTLRFTIQNATLGQQSNGPSDAFEVALLDADTMLPLVGRANGLANTDAMLNIQSTGQIYFGSEVVVPGVETSGEMHALEDRTTVTVDLTGVVPGTRATLYFDLLGFVRRTAPLSSMTSC